MKKRGIFTNKKAQGDIESYFVIIKLILALSAISVMAAYVYSVASDTFFYKLYFSRDIAFTIDAIYSAPGNIYHEYDRKGLDKFNIDFYEQKVKINEEDYKKKALSFNYFYATDLNYEFEKNEIKKSNKIVFQKLPDIFKISNQLNKELKLIKCPEIITTDPEWKKKLFLVDPVFGDKNTNEGIILGSIGFSLYNRFENKETTRNNIEASDIKEQTRKSSIEIKELIENSDIIISTHMGNYLSNNNNIKVYTSSVGDEELVKKRKKLGCLILNELFSDEELNEIFTGGNVIPSNPAHIGVGYEKVLNNDKIGVVIEIGNTQSEKIKNLENVEIINKIAEGIYNGVKKYYD